jgi:hypothetical protein
LSRFRQNKLATLPPAFGQMKLLLDQVSII